MMIPLTVFGLGLGMWPKSYQWDRETFCLGPPWEVFFMSEGFFLCVAHKKRHSSSSSEYCYVWMWLPGYSYCSSRNHEGPGLKSTRNTEDDRAERWKEPGSLMTLWSWSFDQLQHCLLLNFLSCAIVTSSLFRPVWSEASILWSLKYPNIPT